MRVWEGSDYCVVNPRRTRTQMKTGLETQRTKRKKWMPPIRCATELLTVVVASEERSLQNQLMIVGVLKQLVDGHLC